MLKKFWLCLSLATLFITSNSFAQNISDVDREEVDRATRPFLYENETKPETDSVQDLCDPNNPNSENCNLFQIENGKPQSAFQEPRGRKTD